MSFKPEYTIRKSTSPGRNVSIYVAGDFYKIIQKAANDHNVSIPEFIRQALRYALDNLEPGK